MATLASWADRSANTSESTRSRAACVLDLGLAGQGSRRRLAMDEFVQNGGRYRLETGSARGCGEKRGGDGTWIPPRRDAHREQKGVRMETTPPGTLAAPERVC